MKPPEDIARETVAAHAAKTLNPIADPSALTDAIAAAIEKVEQAETINILRTALAAFTDDLPDNTIDFYAWFAERTAKARAALDKASFTPRQHDGTLV
jgi:hypothetical protein